MELAPVRAPAVREGIEEEMVELTQLPGKDPEAEALEFMEGALRLGPSEILCLTIRTKPLLARFTGTSIYYLSSAVRGVAVGAVLDKEQPEMLAVGAEQF